MSFAAIEEKLKLALTLLDQSPEGKKAVEEALQELQALQKASTTVDCRETFDTNLGTNGKLELTYGRATGAEEPAIPDPAYKPKSGALRQPGPPGSVVELCEVAALPEGKSLYAFLISAVVPRPIAFVSSISSDGVVNLAPFSFYGVMSHDPPTLVFCPIYRAGKPKDTLANCMATGECVVNMISEHFVEAANCCCGEYPAEVDEFEVSGLTKAPSKLPKGTPRVEEAMVQFECKVVECKELIGRSGKGSCAIVICEVLRVYAHSGILRKTAAGSDYVDVDSYKPISRLGGNDYGRTGGVFEIPRPPADLWKTVS